MKYSGIRYLLIGVLAWLIYGCSPQVSGDRLATEPDQDEDVQLLLGYLNDKERSNRDNPSFYYHRSNAFLESGEINAALEDIEKAIKLNPEQAEYYELKSNLHMERKSYTRALSAGLKAQELGSRGPRTYIAVASAWSSLENYQKALEAIETAIAILPLDFDLYYQKSLILKEKGDMDGSEKALNEVLQINPGYAPALFDMIDINTARGDFESSYALLDRASKVEGMENQSLWALTELLYQQEKIDSAALYANQLKHRPDFRKQSYQLLGQIKYRKYQYDSVLYFTRKILEEDSLDVEALILNARTWDRKQFYQRSAQTYGRILEIDSTNQLVQDELAKLNRKVAYLRKLEEERSNAPMVLPLKRKEITN